MKTRLIALVPLAVLASADEPAEKRWRAGFDAGVAAAAVGKQHDARALPG